METLEAALPGLPDLASMFGFSLMFYQMHPSGEFSEKIISAYGVTEYSLTLSGLAALKTEKFNALKRKEMRKYFNIRINLDDYYYVEEDLPGRNTKKIKDLLKLLNAEVVSFSISFQPFN